MAFVVISATTDRMATVIVAPTGNFVLENEEAGTRTKPLFSDLQTMLLYSLLICRVI
jgi:hypothetical protein